MTLRYESEHFAFYWKDGTNITVADITKAGGAVDTLENEIWTTYFGSPMFMPEPYCDQTTKYKAGIHIDNTYPLLGGAYDVGQATRVPGMWVGPGAMSDHWGLGHEFMHGVQSNAGGLVNGGGGDYVGWIFESHANFAPHQLEEYAGNVHCSELLANAPHLYLGSTRDRYCNWQFMEYLKDKECYRAVNEIWTTPNSNDPFSAIMTSRGWSVSDLNDFIGEWAMHNVTWDYKASANAFRDSYGKITDTSLPERRNRITRLEPLDDTWQTSRRFASPYHWAPQRFGYNVAELVPEAGSSEVKVTFRGVLQPEANNVSGNARIEDHAIILAGATVSGGTVGGLSVIGGQGGFRTYSFSVTGTATVRTTFVPMGYFEGGQGASGSALLLGDIEYRGDGLNRSSGSFSGFVDSSTQSMNVTEVTPKPPYAFR
ncbi:DUF6055 domain-containing protein [Sorangium sp. So ce1000]|uniref:DUF6055 domain-containing protein n=1 Tax=Sorangium sp. So ce1000 TaxID=3133325 RepID=UPI003F5F3F97